jgi:hypothetical protein
MTTTIYASDQPLLSIELEQEIPDADSLDADQQIVRELVQALDAFADSWVSPLAVGFAVVHRDPNNYFEEVGLPPEPHYLLREQHSPADVRIRPAFSNSRVEVSSKIDSHLVESALLRALNQSAPAGGIVSFSQLEWTAVRTLSPTPDASMLDVGGHPSTAIYEKANGSLWYFGPAGIAGPPLRVRATSTHYTLTLAIEVYWQLWIKYAPGRALLDAAIERVAGRPGWQRCS